MLQPLLQRRIKEAFRDEVHGKKTADGKHSTADWPVLRHGNFLICKIGWARVSLHYTTYRITARLNSLVIVGEEMCKDDRNN
jgi:hypothetical protein